MHKPPCVCMHVCFHKCVNVGVRVFVFFFFFFFFFFCLPHPLLNHFSPLLHLIAWVLHTDSGLATERHKNVLILTTSNITEAIDLAFVDRFVPAMPP